MGDLLIKSISLARKRLVRRRTASRTFWMAWSAPL